MTTTDKLNATITSTINQIFDQEPLNYLEAAGLFTIVAAGRLNMSTLEIFYNQANDPDLKSIIKQAIAEQTEWLVEGSEEVIQERKISLPSFHFSRHKLHNSALSIPDDARFTDHEIVLSLSNMAKASQLTVMVAMHQTYQPHIAIMYRKTLDAAFDFDYRLLRLALEKGWLPHLPKVEH